MSYEIYPQELLGLPYFCITRNLMKILAFGIVKEIFGSGAINVAHDEGVSVEKLKGVLELQYPALKKLSSYMIAVNGEYAALGTIINAADEVAIIPPVSGG